jgi:hypothetical protein
MRERSKKARIYICLAAFAGSQLFRLENPMWARYLLLQVLSHYGSESVCAINGFAAYGGLHVCPWLLHGLCVLQHRRMLPAS